MWNQPLMRMLIAVMLLALTVPGLAAEPTKKDLTTLQQRLVALGNRVEAIKRHLKTKDFRGDEEIWQAQDAQIEAIKKDYRALMKDFYALQNQLPPQGSELGKLFNQVRPALEALDPWVRAKGSWLFAGSGNPSLKAIEANEARAGQEFRKLRDQAAAALK